MVYRDIASRATAAINRHFGVDAVFGLQTATVVLEEPTISELGGAALDEDVVMVMAADALTGLERGSNVTVDGEDFVVREIYLSSDSVTHRVGLSRA